MLKRDLIVKNPLRAIEPDSGAYTTPHRLGLVIARAGTGKTALLVQIALDSMLRGNRVVHVSVGESLDKTRAWYEDLFRHLAQAYQLEHAQDVYREIMRNRMIMTFKATSFAAPKLEERLNDLVYQDIFKPECLVIDGFDFTQAARKDLADIRELMQAMNLHVWFSAIRHRDDTRVSDLGVPAPCHDLADLFETIILLDPRQEGISLKILKDHTVDRGARPSLLLDPATFLVKGQ
ncbi:MAG: hypothetical protein AB1634_07655 [Thermodesulfobacteriota bacterium]